MANKRVAHKGWEPARLVRQGQLWKGSTNLIFCGKRCLHREGVSTTAFIRDASIASHRGSSLSAFPHFDMVAAIHGVAAFAGQGCRQAPFGKRFADTGLVMG